MARPPGLRFTRWAGACGTAASCLLTMVILPLGAAGTAASAAAGMEAMAGTAGPGSAGPGAGSGGLALGAQVMLLASIPLSVLGLWGYGWPMRALSASGGGVLYASMYLLPSLPLFIAGAAGMAAAYGWTLKRG